MHSKSVRKIPVPFKAHYIFKIIIIFAVEKSDIKMTNEDFWKDINLILEEGFTSRNLQKLDRYAEQFISHRLVYKRFSPLEQHGCSAGGTTHVVASLLAGANVAADKFPQGLNEFQRECQYAETQAARIESWTRAVGCWTDDVDLAVPKVLGKQLAEGGEAHVYAHGATLIKTIGLDYFIQPVLALDRISLHNAFFPETLMTVLGFGKTTNGFFQIIVEQPFIQGNRMKDEEIAVFAEKLGFKLMNPRNWTFATPEIYLSDLHDENVIQSSEGTVFVIDCDIRINTPELRQGGIRKLTNEVEFSD